MTSREMQYNFELKVHEVHKINKTWISTDVNQFLNKSQEMIIEERYTSSIGSPEDYFEGNEMIRAELGSLITNYNATAGQLSTGTTTHNNGHLVSLPSNFMYALEERCLISYTDCNTDSASKDIMVKPITHDEYLANVKNPYSMPYEDLIWRMDGFESSAGIKKHELITDGTIGITNYNLRYLKRPNDINVLSATGDCELNVMLHDKIVDRAVIIAVSTIPKQVQIEQ